VFGTTANSANNHYLFYVPTGINDPKVTYADTITSGVVTQTAAQAQAQLDAIINSNGLSKYRGKIAPRNAFHDPWFTKIDLHLEQQIPTFVGKSRIAVFADVENVLNLLNHNWGETLRASFPYFKSLVNVTCAAANGNSCDHYIYSKTVSTTSLSSPVNNFNLGASLYTIRVGARFTF
jgi:hypothetical protein